jgi:hypothetical protein
LGTAISLRNVINGAAAGAIAVWVMDRFDWFAFNHVDQKARNLTEAVRPHGMDPAHALAAKAAAAAGIHLKPAPSHRHPAGLAVHYAVPMTLAILYDALKQRSPIISKGAGAFYGAMTFILLDEVVNPLIGLAAKPAKYPWQRHARELTTHILYGATTHAMLNLLSRRTDKRAA